MSIVLSPEAEQQIEELVRAGKFASADEFVRRSVDRYREEQAWLVELAGREDIQRQLEEGLRDIKEGRYTHYDAAGSRALAEEIKREGRIAMGMPADAS
jgi:Arc/MetJ-type ribon-helix-helix transcriptional regulator